MEMLEENAVDSGCELLVYIYTAQTSHYPPGNHHVSHFYKLMSYFQVITTW